MRRRIQPALALLAPFLLALTLLILGSLLFSGTAMAAATDMRQVRIDARAAEAAMKEKAAKELQEARQAAAKSRREITEDREKLDRVIADLARRTGELKTEIKALKETNEHLAGEEKALIEKVTESRGMIKELSGVIRMNAKDIRTLLDSSFLSGVYQPDTTFLKAIADKSVFPDMAHIRQMADLLFDRIDQGGAVTLETASMVDRNGKTTEARILLAGCFTAAYQLPGETGFLNHTPGGKNLYALSSLPPKSMQEKMDRYMAGAREALPMDISRGGALRQLTLNLSLWDQIPEGGPIVWPILAILGLGALITLERLFFLLRRKIRLEKVCADIQNQAETADWQGCASLCDCYARNPVIRVVRAGIQNRTLPREDMENAVQEAILKEIPPMERFLSTMGMLAAIAPLLGLLGTVTGMIDTFHVITLHGTGDPRMMSGGISEALVTTMLGLSVAIPIMLSHTLLSRAVENTVGLMEEKAVALINIVQKTSLKTRGINGPPVS